MVRDSGYSLIVVENINWWNIFLEGNWQYEANLKAYLLFSLVISILKNQTLLFLAIWQIKLTEGVFLIKH